MSSETTTPPKAPPATARPLCEFDEGAKVTITGTVLRVVEGGFVEVAFPSPNTPSKAVWLPLATGVGSFETGRGSDDLINAPVGETVRVLGMILRGDRSRVEVAFYDVGACESAVVHWLLGSVEAVTL